jgi:hypothetical protein
LALVMGDGFTLVSATTTAGSTPGALDFTITAGGFTAGPNTIGLLAPVPSEGSGGWPCSWSLQALITMAGPVSWRTFYATRAGARTTFLRRCRLQLSRVCP